MSSDAFLDALADAVGSAHVLTDADARAGYEIDWTRRFSGAAAAVVRPGSTAEVAEVVRVCAARGVAIVPQGGNTGLVGGGVPRSRAGAAQPPVVLSTRRLEAIEPVDADDGSAVAGAGASLADVQRAARAAGWDVGCDLASRDQASVGGMLATNAGGEHVLRYGSFRNQVLALEAVLADGTVIGRVPGLRKDNTGLHWPSVLAGSEGTLAIVTRVHLALVPALPDRVVALLGFAGFDDALAAAGRCRRALASLVALEVVFADGLRLVREHTGLPAPLPGDPAVCLLVECAGPTGSTDALTAQLEAVLADCLGLGSAVATDPARRARLWEYRERHTETVNALGIPHKLDVTLPRAALAAFVPRVRAAVDAVAPGATTVLFGHVGDGNLHVNVVGPASDDDAVDRAVLGLVAEMGGSISAEHGIGVAKRALLGLSRSAADVAAQRAVKQALDPAGLLNPGVLLG